MITNAFPTVPPLPPLGLAGRSRELHAFWAALHGSGGRVFLVSGEAGLGKTALMATWADQARELGWRPLWVDPTRAPFSEREPTEQLFALLREACVGADPRTEPLFDAWSVQPSAENALQALQALPPEPTVVFVDHAGEEAAALLEWVQRAPSELRWVISLPPEQGAAWQALGDALVECPLGPLRRHHAEQLLAQKFRWEGEALPEATHRLAGGNPLALMLAIDGVDRVGEKPGAARDFLAQPEDERPPLRRLVEAWLPLLSPIERRALFAWATLAPGDAHLAHAVGAHPPESLVAKLPFLNAGLPPSLLRWVRLAAKKLDRERFDEVNRLARAHHAQRGDRAGAATALYCLFQLDPVKAQTLLMAFLGRFLRTDPLYCERVVAFCERAQIPKALREQLATRRREIAAFRRQDAQGSKGLLQAVADLGWAAPSGKMELLGF